MIGLGLWVLNLVIWIWFIGFLCSLPLLTRNIIRLEDTFKVGDLWIIFGGSVCWFLCIQDMVEEIEDAFEWESGTIEQSIENFMEIDLIKSKRS